MQFGSIQLTDRTPSGANTPNRSERRKKGNDGVLCIPQSFSII